MGVMKLPSRVVKVLLADHQTFYTWPSKCHWSSLVTFCWRLWGAYLAMRIWKLWDKIDACKPLDGMALNFNPCIRDGHQRPRVIDRLVPVLVVQLLEIFGSEASIDLRLISPRSSVGLQVFPWWIPSAEPQDQIYISTCLFLSKHNWHASDRIDLSGKDWLIAH